MEESWHIGIWKNKKPAKSRPYKLRFETFRNLTYTPKKLRTIMIRVLFLLYRQKASEKSQAFLELNLHYVFIEILSTRQSILS